MRPARATEARHRQATPLQRRIEEALPARLRYLVRYLVAPPVLSPDLLRAWAPGLHLESEDDFCPGCAVPGLSGCRRPCLIQADPALPWAYLTCADAPRLLQRVGDPLLLRQAGEQLGILPADEVPLEHLVDLLQVETYRLFKGEPLAEIPMTIGADLRRPGSLQRAPRPKSPKPAAHEAA